MRVFLICPVRGITPAEHEAVAAYVAELERRGVSVYWPERDTDQRDDIGVRICASNLAGMEPADEVHVWWSPRSEGSVFDLGAAFALRKRLVLANAVGPTPGKSFANVLRALAVPEAA
jgi:nucleoside 2-deoxyribosyltransferase